MLKGHLLYGSTSKVIKDLTEKASGDVVLDTVNMTFRDEKTNLGTGVGMIKIKILICLLKIMIVQSPVVVVYQCTNVNDLVQLGRLKLFVRMLGTALL